VRTLLARLRPEHVSLHDSFGTHYGQNFMRICILTSAGTVFQSAYNTHLECSRVVDASRLESAEAIVTIMIGSGVAVARNKPII
jgi:hypothetical protein